MSDPIPQFASTESLKEHIRETISSVSRIDIAELKDNVLIREELGIDSLMAMEIVAKCEKQLGIRSMRPSSTRSSHWAISWTCLRPAMSSSGTRRREDPARLPKGHFLSKSRSSAVT